jgi:hypothetical protein
MAYTVLLEFAFHGVAAPVAVLSAAIPVRAWPPIIVNEPHAYTVAPLTRMSLTELPVTPGFHAVAAPVVVSTAATRDLGCPPMLVNWPPT